MPSFRPGIRKEQVKNLDRLRREEMPHRMQNIKSQDPRVAQLELADLPRSPTPSTGQALHAQEIPVWSFRRERSEESSVTTTEIHLERCGAPEYFG